MASRRRNAALAIALVLGGATLMARRYVGGPFVDGTGNGGSSFNATHLSVDARPGVQHALLPRTGYAYRNAANKWAIRFDESTIGNPSSVTLREGYFRFFFRPRALPTSDQEVVSLNGTGTGSSSTDDVRIYLTTGGTLRVENDGGGGVPQVRGESDALTLGQSYCIEILWAYNTITAQPAPNPPYDTDDDLEVTVDGVLITDVPIAVTTYNFGLSASSGLVRGLEWNIGGSSANGGWFDVFLPAIDDSEPIGDTWISSIIEAAAAGSYSAWAGGQPDWRARSPYNPGATGSAAVTTNVNGAQITYQMQSLRARGITGQIKCVMAIWYATQGASAKPVFIRNGVQTTLTDALWTANNWRVWRLTSDAEADGWTIDDVLELGAVCQAASTHGLGSVALIVEHNTPEPEPVDGVYRVMSDTYQGNALAQTTNLGAIAEAVTNQLPALFFIVPVGTATQPWWWMSSRFGGSPVDAAIAAFIRVWMQAGRFHVIHPTSGMSLNANGVTYRWIALFDPRGRFLLPHGVSKHSTVPDPLTITLREPHTGEAVPAFTPEFAFGARATAATNDAPGAAMYRGPGNVGDLTSTLANTTAPSADRIQALDAGEVDLGTLIAGGTAFDYAFLFGKVTGESVRRLTAIDTYSGNASNPRTRTLDLDGCEPLFIIGIPHNTDAKVYRVRGDSTSRLWTSGVAQANAFTAFGVDSVTIGSALNASGVVYDLWAITAGTAGAGAVDAPAPIAVNDAYECAYQGSIVVSAAEGVLVNDDDEDGGTMTASIVSTPNPAHGTLLDFQADGSFEFEAAALFRGDATFTYRAVTPDGGQSEIATVTITVLPTTPPIGNADRYETRYGHSLTVAAAAGVLANDEGGPGGTLTAAIVEDATHGTLTLEDDGSLTYHPDAGYFGTDTFTYQPETPGGGLGLETLVEIVVRPPVLPTSIPLIFARIVTSTETIVIAETQLADPSTWYDGFKPATLLRVSPIRRELADDGYRVNPWTIEIADPDREWRGRGATTTLEGSYVELFYVEDAVRRLQGDAIRIAAGLVSSSKALPGFRYQLQIESVVGQRFGELFQQPIVPFKLMSVTEFSGLDPSMEGKVWPIAYGALSDEDADTPQGVVRAHFIGTTNLSVLGGIDQEVDAYIFVAHAVKMVHNVYYNDPTTPDVRAVVPDISFGDFVWCPHKPDWSADTGLATQYVDYNGFRYTPIFVDSSISLAAAAREGKVIITANLDGIETVGDTTGDLIETGEEIAVHVLANFILGQWQQGAWLSLPTLESGLSIVDEDSLAACIAVGAARAVTPYKAAVLLGADGSPQSFFDVLTQLMVGTDFEVGENRHGQLFFDREDAAAPATVAFDAYGHIVDGAFDTDIDRRIRTNRVEFLYGERYVAPSAPRATPAEGDPLPITPVAPFAKWASDLQVTNATAAQTAVGRVIVRRMENRVVRDSTTAASVAEHVLTRGVGPLATLDGPRVAQLMTDWQGIIRDYIVVTELGTVAAITHPEGLSAEGWTDKRARVRAITIDPQPGTVTLEGRVLEDDES